MNTGRKYQEQFIIRLPNGMRDWIKGEASKNLRSMNSEIVIAIQEKMKQVIDQREASQ